MVQVHDVRLSPELAREGAAERELLPESPAEHSDVHVAVRASPTPRHRSEEDHQAQANDGARLHQRYRGSEPERLTRSWPRARAEGC